MALPAYAMSQSNFPQMYERFIVGPLFRPWVEVLLDRTAVAAGERVLDLACGTGIVARVALERVAARGQVVGIDVSAPMLEVARAIAPDVEWREGNATALPVGDEEKFDVILCQQGFQFFGDRPTAAQECRRVLASGGRIAASTWLGLSETPLFRDLNEVGERHLGAIADARFGLGDGAALGRLFADAGFRDVRIDRVVKKIRFPEPERFVRLNAMAIVGMSAASAGMAEEERTRIVDAIVTESAPVVARYSEGGGFVADVGANVATARR
jgi:ubiquinone/menaquinone biosynthesis C-methylase UbiE